MFIALITFFNMAQMVKCLLTLRETRVRFLGQEDPLEKEKATHSSIHAWRILWIEEPGGLHSKGSQGIRHYWAHAQSLCLKPSSGFYCICNKIHILCHGCAESCVICSWPATPASLYTPLLPLLVLDALVFLVLLSSLGPWHELFSPACMRSSLVST